MKVGEPANQYLKGGMGGGGGGEKTASTRLLHLRLRPHESNVFNPLNASSATPTASGPFQYGHPPEAVVKTSRFFSIKGSTLPKLRTSYLHKAVITAGKAWRPWTTTRDRGWHRPSWISEPSCKHTKEEYLNSVLLGPQHF